LVRVANEEFISAKMKKTAMPIQFQVVQFQIPAPNIDQNIREV